MGLKKYVADADTTIVNAFPPNLQTRATGANAGAADVMEVYSIYGRENTGSQELSRVLVKFPISSISTDRTNGVVPASGSVSFYLKLYNAQTSKTVPRDLKLVVLPVSQSWQEGVGLDLENYKDKTKGNTGANWMSASNTAAWTSVGGDYLISSSFSAITASQTFSTGLEHLEVDITPLVEKWMSGDINNYGVGVHLTASQEAYYSSSTGQNTGSIIDNVDGATKSYYTKRFFARGSQFFFSRPAIEARWNSTTKDDRGDFTYSSSLAPPSENLNTLYLYNYVRGQLTNIPVVGTGKIYVSLYSGSAAGTAPSGSRLKLYDSSNVATGGYVSTGIYSCSVGITASNTPLKRIYDVWFSGSTVSGSDKTQFYTSSFEPTVVNASPIVTNPVYYLNITNLRNKYRSNETARFNLYVRHKNWNPTIFTVAEATAETTTIHSASYRVYRLLDGLEAVPYGTGSDLHTLLEYDMSGNYFDFDMDLLEPGYAYGFKFSFYNSALRSWLEQPYAFKFRVEDYEY